MEVPKELKTALLNESEDLIDCNVERELYRREYNKFLGFEEGKYSNDSFFLSHAGCVKEVECRKCTSLLAKDFNIASRKNCLIIDAK